jgi:biopolymer transport protein ExbD
VNFIGCYHSRYLESSSNLVFVVCEKYRLTLNNTPYCIEDLKINLFRIKRATTGNLQVLIRAARDCPYQQVIDVVDACNEGTIYLGLQLPGAPIPELPSEEKNE